MVLVVCEKNDAARRISAILSDGKSRRSGKRGVPVYSFEKDGKQWDVIGLRGHIVKLDYPEGNNSWRNTDLEELALTEPIKKEDLKNYVSVLHTLAKKHDEVIIATDYDREGELIGIEAIEIIKQDNENVSIKRAKFSALTRTDILNAFSNLQDVNYKLAAAAESRQHIDLAWGAVLTRYLSLTAGKSGRNYLSAGRVQTPTLALIVDREKEIQNFKPEPYWEIRALLNKEIDFQAEHEEGRITDKDRADNIYQKVRDAKIATIRDVSVEEKKDFPPTPFDTTTFLAEATKLNLTPARALSVAETLYTHGYISYPRTDNTVYPRTTSFSKILDALEKAGYSREVKEIRSQDKLRPTRGKKETTDHPPITPEEPPNMASLSPEEKKVYDLIARRFLATLAPPTVVKDTKLSLDIEGENFRSHGVKIISPGWRKYYTFIPKEEIEVPDLSAGDKADVKEIKMDAKKTQPPKRYSQAALLKAMEKLMLGTKSTRADIIQKIIERGYVKGRTMRPTLTGMAVISSLEAHAKQITRSEMTAKLESDMDKITSGEKDMDSVVSESRELLKEAVRLLKKNTSAIHDEISEAMKKENAIGKCPNCGKTLVVRKNKATGKRFIGCTGYPDCKTTYPLPQFGNIYPTEDVCPVCNSPIILVYPAKRKGRGRRLCVNPECPENKKYWDEIKKYSKNKQEKKDMKKKEK